MVCEPNAIAFGFFVCLTDCISGMIIMSVNVRPGRFEIDICVDWSEGLWQSV